MGSVVRRAFGYLFFVRYWPAWSELPEGVVQQVDSLPEARAYSLRLREEGVRCQVERLHVVPIRNGLNITVEGFD